MGDDDGDSGACAVLDLIMRGEYDQLPTYGFGDTKRDGEIRLFLPHVLSVMRTCEGHRLHIFNRVALCPEARVVEEYLRVASDEHARTVMHEVCEVLSYIAVGADAAPIHTQLCGASAAYKNACDSTSSSSAAAVFEGECPRARFLCVLLLLPLPPPLNVSLHHDCGSVCTFRHLLVCHASTASKLPWH